MQAAKQSTHQLLTTLVSAGVGIFTTLVVVVLLYTGVLERFELITLDQRFLHANATPTHPDLVCVAIDDGSIETVGRWPWSRAKQASMIRTLGRCRARAVIVDLSWVDGEPVSLDMSPFEDLVAAPDQLAASVAYRRFSDGELREALKAVGNCYLAFHAKADDLWHSPEFESALETRAGGEEVASEELAGRYQPHFESVVRFIDQPQMPLVGNTDQHEARRAALRAIVRSELAQDAELDASGLFAKTHARVAPGEEAQNEDALSLDLRQAVIRVLGERATREVSALKVDATDLPPDWKVDGLEPVLPSHAEVAKRCGFVSFEPDFDSVARRLHLLVQHGDTILPQLGFAFVCDEFGVEPELIRSSGSDQIKAIGLGEMIVQVDEEGRALIPWIAESDWTKQFGPHVPADILVELGEWEAQLIFMRHQRELLAAELFLYEGVPGHEVYRSFLVSMDHAARTGQLLLLSEQLTEAEQTRVNNLAALRVAHSAAKEKGDAQQVDELGFLLEEIPQLELLMSTFDERINELSRRYEEGLDSVRSRIENRICFIGYTASALADMTPIPTHPRAPGVLAHMNLVNGLLMGTTIQWWPLWFNAALTLAVGFMATSLNVYLRPRSAAGLTLLVVAGYVVITFGVFYSDVWLQLVYPVVAGVGSAIAIQFYRFVFIDRERRQLSTALSQYTSPAIARLVAEDVELCRRAEQREVSVMFTDLKGFTTISERIGAERTQAVLNTCLGRFTEVIQHREGLVNKFLGDGIFAFWNPVIYPQDNHALLSMQTAFDLCVALKELRTQYRDDDPTFADLAMRIGVATGEAVVGPCGSEQKYDYTCIGDTVNLAARLESANKYFGTAILINQNLHDAVGDDYLYRSIGSVQVKGKRLGVPVFEPLGKRGEVPDERLRHADRFATAVEKFVSRDWEGAGAGFGDCIIEDPNDLAAMRYAEWCDRFAHQPPDEDWNGALELLEK